MPEETKYNITLFEACELLSRSRMSLSRYIRKGLLHPQEIKSQKGVLEYRFSQDDLEAFKQKEKIRKQNKADSITEHLKETDNALPEENKEKVLDKARDKETEQPDSETEHNATPLYNVKEENQNKPINKQPDSETEHNRETGHFETARTEKIIKMLEDTTGLLKEQLGKKDEQIAKLGNTVDNLVERNREMNILFKGLQDRLLMLENPKGQGREKQEEAGEPTPEKMEDKQGFFNKLFS